MPSALVDVVVTWTPAGGVAFVAGITIHFGLELEWMADVLSVPSVSPVQCPSELPLKV